MGVKMVPGFHTLCVLFAVVVSTVASLDPMVAFMCNKPAMYRTKDGWKREETTDCLKKPIDILNFCRKVYPDKDITNVVEASKVEEITNWCRKGKKHCHMKTHTVTPFRCLEGAFQSDALLVPEHCMFDHIHDSGKCLYYPDWNKTALKSCVKRSMKLKSFAILLPCGIDQFSGVEFVCCPAEKAESHGVPILQAPKQGKSHGHHHKAKPHHDMKTHNDHKKHPEHDSHHEKSHKEHHDSHKEPHDSHEEHHPTYEVHEHEFKAHPDHIPATPAHQDHAHQDHAHLEHAHQEHAHQEHAKHKDTYKFQEDKTVKEQVDEYMAYMHSANLGHYLNEHQRYKAAEKKWLQHHREKITKMMKEWAAARKRVQEMRSTDPKAAQKLNIEITSRFQKTYQALEQEGLAQKKQLVAVHQQRVQADLNQRKRDSMERYMKALTDRKPKASHILKTLKHYLQTEQKDRMHAVNHYKHMREIYPDYADKIRLQTINHIKIIEQRMNQSLAMLSRVPEYQKKVRVQIDEFLRSFHDVDASIVNVLMKPHKEEKHKQPHHHTTKKVLPPEPKPAKNKKGKAHKSHKVALHKEPITVHKFDDETMEDEHADMPVLKLQKSHIAHGAVNNLGVQQGEAIKQEGVVSAGNMSSTLGIAVGCIAVFVIVVVAVVVLRKKVQRVPMNHAYVDVDHAVSPEEKHVSNMQINGYENPTYKYFEKTPTTNA